MGLTVALLALAGPSGGLRAGENAPPKPGAVAPDFSLKTPDGRAVRLHEVTARGATVLVVLRGYPGYQCPICTQQVGELLSREGDLRAAGGQVLLVYPGAPDRAREFLKARPLPGHFTLVLDPDYRFLRQYGLRWEAPNETAYPSTFVLDPQNRVRWSIVSKSHGGRARIADVLGALKSLRG